MEALLRARHGSSRLLQRIFPKRHLQLDPRLASLASLQSLDRRPLPYVRMRLHPDWRQMDNKIRRMDSRLGDFRILSNDLRIQKQNLESDDPSLNKARILEAVKQREVEVETERAAIKTELLKLTAEFVQGAQREYVTLRKFFLWYLFRMTRNAFENLNAAEFDKLLKESPEGITFELPDRGTITFAPHLCTKLSAAQRLSLSLSGLDSSPLAIALAILQAPSTKHCDDPLCRREECHILKSDYEEMFEAFFKRKPRAMVFQKTRGEMPSEFDDILSIENTINTT